MYNVGTSLVWSLWWIRCVVFELELYRGPTCNYSNLTTCVVDWLFIKNFNSVIYSRTLGILGTAVIV